MHEFTVAQSIVDSVLHEAQIHNAKKVNEIDVDVGELMQVDIDVLEKALVLLLDGPLMKETKARLHLTHARFSCRKCGHDWLMEESKKQLSAVADELLVREPDSKELPLHFLPYLYPVFLHCGRCGSADIEVPQGEEIVLRRVVMEE